MALSSPRCFFFLGAAVLLSCQEPDPNYGDPGGINGKKLPNEGSTPAATTGTNGPFPSAYDGNANRPTTTVKASHTAAASKGAPTAFDAPLVCGDCHKSGGTAQAFIWAFGGRVIKNGAAIPNVDVIVTGDTTIGPVKTDTDGFFWAPGNPIGSGQHAAIRSQSGTSSMSGSPGQSCDTTGCHQDGAQGRIGKGLP